jgi:hypothetical protein
VMSALICLCDVIAPGNLLAIRSRTVVAGIFMSRFARLNRRNYPRAMLSDRMESK